MLVAFVAGVQFRTQAEVARSLEAQDNTALAFLIDGLHRANEALSAEVFALTGRRDQLRSGSAQAAQAELSDDVQRLRMVEGLVPVVGPGVTVNVDGSTSRTPSTTSGWPAPKRSRSTITGS
jgi:uncharacterized protein YlxW (UPF0749 family)